MKHKTYSSRNKSFLFINISIDFSISFLKGIISAFGKVSNCKIQVLTVNTG